MSAPLPTLRTEESPPLYRDVRVIRWAGQIAVVAAVVGIAVYLYGNVITNLETAGFDTNFNFLDRKYGAAIPGIQDSADFTIRRAFLAGYRNTILVILVGIPACTLLGILIGIARLSKNAAVRTFGTLYVELFRNIPVLLWIFVVHFVIRLDIVPRITDEVTPFNSFVVSNVGLGIPWFNPESTVSVFLIFALLGLLAAAAAAKWRGSVNAKTGEPARGGTYGLLAFLAVIVVGHFVSGGALALEGSGIENGRTITGGMTVDAAYASLTLALILYTASHIAEIVRGAIQAIHKGQEEAASAIALNTYQRYRYVILPQAFRIMIPPLASQYLNITKNSSLAVGVGYLEVTGVFQKVSNNSSPAVLVIPILMLAYLTLSLSISLVANFFNRRLALDTR